MNVSRIRPVVSPHFRRDLAAQSLPSVASAVLARRPDVPMACLRPAVVAAEARRFVRAFPGRVLYAVKCNPDEAVLKALAAGGIRHFDAASLAEVRLVRRLFPDVGIHFMHPFKARSAIRESYAELGVRDFVIDTPEELTKIVEETDGATDLGLVVRLALDKGEARLDLSGKFGASPAEAVVLLRLAAERSGRLGLSFHVGSQCCDPAAWERALTVAGEVIDQSGVTLAVLDVGGGFPVAYPDQVPPPLGAFMAAIRRGVTRLGLPADCRLWCEPGRALVASGQSVVVRVVGRRGNALYLNDGVYGSLSDAGALGFRYPCRLIRDTGPSEAPLVGFSLFGPTCDSLDRMDGPFLLPADIMEGDWIEIGQLGAYGTCLRTGFNGFDEIIRVDVDESPLLQTSGYTAAAARAA